MLLKMPSDSKKSAFQTQVSDIKSQVVDAKGRVKRFSRGRTWNGDPENYMDLVRDVEEQFNSDPVARMVLGAGYFEWDPDTSSWLFRMPRTADVIRLAETSKGQFGTTITISYEENREISETQYCVVATCRTIVLGDVILTGGQSPVNIPDLGSPDDSEESPTINLVYVDQRGFNPEPNRVFFRTTVPNLIAAEKTTNVNIEFPIGCEIFIKNYGKYKVVGTEGQINPMTNERSLFVGVIPIEE